MRRAVEFEAQGKVKALRYDTKALCRIEAETGEPIGVASQRLTGNPRISDLVIFWAAGLGGVTHDEACDLLDEVGFARAGELIGEAIALAFPEAQAEAKKRMGTAA